MSCGGIKNDADKLRMDLIPIEAIYAVCEVMAHGAKKYGDHQYRNGFAWNRLYSAALRHLFSWQEGSDRDLETGFSHIAHAACCLLMLLDHVEADYGYDDRSYPRIQFRMEMDGAPGHSDRAQSDDGDR